MIKNQLPCAILHTFKHTCISNCDLLPLHTGCSMDSTLQLMMTSPRSFIASPTSTHDCGYGQPRRLRSSFHQHVLPPSAIAPFLSSPLVSGMDCHLTLRRPRHCLHSRDASRLNCLHGAIPIAPAASDFPFRLLVDAVTHVFSVFRVCKVP